MGKESHIQTAFNAGELTPQLEGRVDLKKYKAGCQLLENFIPRVTGVAQKRSGTRFVNPALYPTSTTNQSTLIPFEYGTSQAYVLEFNALNMRPYRNGALVLETTHDDKGPHNIVDGTAGSPPVMRVEGLAITSVSDTVEGSVVYTAVPSVADIQNYKQVRVIGVATNTTLNDADWYAVNCGPASFSAATKRIAASEIGITDVTTHATTPTITFSANHSITAGEAVWFTGFTGTNSILNDKYYITASASTNVITVTQAGTDTVGSYSLDWYQIKNTTTGSAGTGGTAHLHGWEDIDAQDEVYITGTTDDVLDDKYWTPTRVNAGEISLSSAWQDLTSLGTVSQGTMTLAHNITTPYLAIEDDPLSADKIQYAQSADVMYMSHPNVFPQKLTRQADDKFTLADVPFTYVPFRPENLDERITMSVDVLTKDSTATLIVAGKDPTEVVASNPARVESAAHGFLDGEFVTIVSQASTSFHADVRNQTYEVSGATTDAFYLKDADFSAYGGSLSVAGTDYFAHAAFKDLAVGDTVQLSEIIGAHAGLWEPNTANDRYAAMVLGGRRYFESNVYELEDLNGFEENGTSPPLHETGIEGDGRWDWEYLHSGGGYVELVTKTSDAEWITTVKRRIPESVCTGTSGVATHRWAEGAWSARNGYPRAVCFFENRLWWGGTQRDQQTFWASESGVYESHLVKDLDESALVATFNTDQVNVIEWMSPGKQLQIGTAGGEFVVSAASEAEALVPGNLRAVRHSTYGSKEYVRPLRIEQVVLFAQRQGRKLRELTFDDATQAYLAPDMSVLADHLTIPGIKKMVFQQEPHRIVWAITESNELLGFTYEREQEVTAWHRHKLGGSNADIPDSSGITTTGSGYVGVTDTSGLSVGMGVSGSGIPAGVVIKQINSSNLFFIGVPATATASSVALTFSPVSEVLDICVIPKPGENRDELWMVTRRTIDSGVRNFIELLESDWDRGDSLTDAFFVDCGSTRTIVGDTITMLEHLELETVDLLIDGVTAAQGSVTAAGTVTGLTGLGTTVQVGLPYRAVLQTMRIESGAKDGTAQGKWKRITDVAIRFDQTGEGVNIGPDDMLANADDITITAGTLLNGDTDYIDWPEGYEQEGRVTIIHNKPTPCTVVATMPRVVTQDGG